MFESIVKGSRSNSGPIGITSALAGTLKKYGNPDSSGRSSNDQCILWATGNHAVKLQHSVLTSSCLCSICAVCRQTITLGRLLTTSRAWRISSAERREEIEGTRLLWRNARPPLVLDTFVSKQADEMIRCIAILFYAGVLLHPLKPPRCEFLCFCFFLLSQFASDFSCSLTCSLWSGVLISPTRLTRHYKPVVYLLSLIFYASKKTDNQLKHEVSRGEGRHEWDVQTYSSMYGLYCVNNRPAWKWLLKQQEEGTNVVRTVCNSSASTVRPLTGRII